MSWRRRHPVSTALFSALILAFAGGPVLLALYGSLVPDRVLLSPERSVVTDGISLESYNYIFTGTVPGSYEVEGANRSMISEAARQVPQSLWNSARIALAAMIHRRRSSMPVTPSRARRPASCSSSCRRSCPRRRSSSRSTSSCRRWG
jgi:ABC-type glycerol-3-phosphate transport system permease component